MVSDKKKKNLITIQESSIALAKTRKVMAVTKKILSNHVCIIKKTDDMYLSDIGYKNYVVCLAITPCGKYLLWGSNRGRIILWDLQKEEQVAIYESHFLDIYALTTTQCGRYIVVGGSGEKNPHTMKILDISTGNILQEHHVSGEVLQFETTSCGKYIITRQHEFLVELLDIQHGELVWDIWLYDIGTPEDIALSSCEKFIAISLYETPIMLLSMETGELVLYFAKSSQDAIYLAAASGDIVLSVGNENIIKAWDLHTGMCLKTFQAPSEDTCGLVTTPCGKYAVTAHLDGTIKLWNILTGEMVQTFLGHKEKITDIVVTPCGNYIISGGWEKVVGIWSIKTGKRTSLLSSYGDKEWIIDDGEYYKCSCTGKKNILKKSNRFIYPRPSRKLKNYIEE